MGKININLSNMKLQDIIKQLLVVVLISLYGCSDFLDPKIDDNYNDETVWSDRTFAMGALVDGYAQLPTYYDCFSNNYLDCATDNAVTNDYNTPILNMALGSWRPNYNPFDTWTNCYRQIRNMNYFLERAPHIKFSNKDELNTVIQRRSKGEAYFLRAWYQFELLSRFSGIATNGQLLGFPIVTKSLPQGENIKQARNSFDDCVKQIYDDIDNSLLYLPKKYDDVNNAELGPTKEGRATAIAAMCLKSRVALYAASPLYTIEKSETEKIKLWETAAQYAMEAIQLSGTSLPAMKADFFEKPDHAEILWRNYQEDINTPEQNNFIPQLYGWGRTNPSQQLVDAFPMKNGYPITDVEHSGYKPEDPYIDRDPRFDLAILYNGATFSKTKVETFEGGLDTESNKEKATRTGYYLRKTISENVSLVPGETVTRAKHHYCIFRKGELWLNYAEAANEAWGPKADPLGWGKTAETMLKELRKRAGINSKDPYVGEVAAAGKDEFRQLVQNERRIELCFENHRFFDIRRWMLPLEVINTPVKGVTIQKVGDTFKYEFDKVVETRNYQDYMYYGPIPEAEVNSTNGLILQNKGW